MTITKGQWKRLHTLLNMRGLLESKREFIYQFTCGRTTSSREMTTEEAAALIRSLDVAESVRRMRKKVWAMAFEAGIIYGNTEADFRMNVAKLNQFLTTRGTVKKPLLKQSYHELIRTVSQMEKIAQHSEAQAHKKEMDALLHQAGISYEKNGKKVRK